MVETARATRQSVEREGPSLAVLPLSIIPLKTAGLKKARIVKNGRLEGVVELFGGEATGSGQIAPEALRQVFEFTARTESDYAVVCALGRLPSYDVYALRLHLRRLGIAVEDVAALKLSDEIQDDLAAYMSEFTRPLVRLVYGDKRQASGSAGELLALFRTPSVEQAVRNLRVIADKLTMTVADIPKFLEDYGDVYLSLAYYRYCLDQTAPVIRSFATTLAAIRNDPQCRRDAAIVQCTQDVEKRLDGLSMDVVGMLDMFRDRTAEIWERLSPQAFARTRAEILGQQTAIAGALCAMSVKMQRWRQAFPDPTAALWAQASFLMSDLRHGFERVQPLRYAD